ncbi:hypothetical protein GCM10027091_37830 [Streptomyces daliensis]
MGEPDDTLATSREMIMECDTGKEVTVKRVYVEPEVEELGTVEELTAHGSILLPDNPTHRTLL